MTYNNNKNNLEFVKIFVYGIITPTIFSFGLYYIFNNGFKNLIKDICKEVLLDMMENKIKKKYK